MLNIQSYTRSYTRFQKITHSSFYAILMLASIPSSIYAKIPNEFEDRSVHTRMLAPLTKPYSTKIGSVEYSQLPIPLEIAATQTPDMTRGNSGYYALKNGLLTLNYVHSMEGQNALIDGLKKAFPSDWRSQVIAHRARSLCLSFIKDQLLLALKGGKKLSYKDINTNDFQVMHTQLAVVVFDQKDTQEHFERLTLIMLLPKVAKRLLAEYEDTFVNQKDVITITLDKQKIKDIIDDEYKRLSTPLLAKDDTNKQLSDSSSMSERLLPLLETVSFTLKTGLNENELISLIPEQRSTQEIETNIPAPIKLNYNMNKSVNSAHNCDCTVDSEQGDWLNGQELSTLFEENKAKNDSRNTASQAIDYLGDSSHSTDALYTLSYPAQTNQYVTLENSLQLEKLEGEIKRKKEQSSDKNFTPLLVLISCDDQWISCVIKKEADSFDLLVTDSQNLNRKNEKGITAILNLLNKINEKPTEPNSFLNNFKKEISDIQAPAQNNEENQPKDNYDAPLAGIPLEELPSLEQLFGGKIPNSILVRLAQLKMGLDVDKKRNKSLKNALIFYGPPGTGKSTVAQVLARLAGRRVFFISGGALRNAYQGSSKAIIDAFFNAALSCPEPSVLLFDEIDGGTTKHEPHNSTQEDIRSIKTIIGKLDQYRHDPRIFVIGTTNYPEKMDPAVLRRFNCIEISLPNYTMRESIIKYYFKEQNVSIGSHGQMSITKDFFDMFVTATQNMSGDAIQDIINNAVQESECSLIPEDTLDLSFHENGLDITNRSIASNIGFLMAAPVIGGVHLFTPSDTITLKDHLYSHLRKRRALEKNLKKAEDKEKKARLGMPEESLLKKIAKTTLSSVHHGFCSALGSRIFDKAWDKAPTSWKPGLASLNGLSPLGTQNNPRS